MHRNIQISPDNYKILFDWDKRHLPPNTVLLVSFGISLNTEFIRSRLVFNYVLSCRKKKHESCFVNFVKKKSIYTDDIVREANM